jgi:uncharacterized protein DUF4265
VTRFTLLGIPLGGDRFEVRRGYAAFANRGDVVRYDGSTHDFEIVEPSGHRTLGVRFATDDAAEVLEELRRRGAPAENTAGRFWLVDVPPEIDVASVEAALERRRVEGVLEWKPATGVELLPWLWSAARASRSRGERAHDWLSETWSIYVLPVALVVLAAALGRSGDPSWVTLLESLAVLLLCAVVLRRLVRRLRADGFRGALRSSLTAPRRRRSEPDETS